MSSLSVNKIFTLSNNLRKRGFNKQADELEYQFLILKKSESKLYSVLKETGEDLIDEAHPQGSFKVQDASDEFGVVETINDQHAKTLKTLKDPTGKYANLVTLIHKQSDLGSYFTEKGTQIMSGARGVAGNAAGGIVSKIMSGPDAIRKVVANFISKHPWISGMAGLALADVAYGIYECYISDADPQKAMDAWSTLDDSNLSLEKQFVNEGTVALTQANGIKVDAKKMSEITRGKSNEDAAAAILKAYPDIDKKIETYGKIANSIGAAVSKLENNTWIKDLIPGTKEFDAIAEAKKIIPMINGQVTFLQRMKSSASSPLLRDQFISAYEKCTDQNKKNYYKDAYDDAKSGGTASNDQFQKWINGLK